MVISFARYILLFYCINGNLNIPLWKIKLYKTAIMTAVRIAAPYIYVQAVSLLAGKKQAKELPALTKERRKALFSVCFTPFGPIQLAFKGSSPGLVRQFLLIK